MEKKKTYYYTIIAFVSITILSSIELLYVSQNKKGNDSEIALGIIIAFHSYILLINNILSEILNYDYKRNKMICNALTSISESLLIFLSYSLFKFIFLIIEIFTVESKKEYKNSFHLTTLMMLILLIIEIIIITSFAIENNRKNFKEHYSKSV